MQTCMQHAHTRKQWAGEYINACTFEINSIDILWFVNKAKVKMKEFFLIISLFLCGNHASLFAQNDQCVKVSDYMYNMKTMTKDFLMSLTAIPLKLPWVPPSCKIKDASKIVKYYIKTTLVILTLSRRNPQINQSFLIVYRQRRR